MVLFSFHETSAVAGGGEENLTGAGEGRAAAALAQGAKGAAGPVGRQFARLLTTRGQRAAAARRARAGR
jgi:hypothetical protein